MIIQCDQCNTKFKLDDAKVPDKGVKVRCAKCKQVFMVQRETSSEEPDLDFLLSGLGAQESGAEKGLATPGETLSPPKEKEEWDSLAPSSSASAEEEFEVPAAGSAEHTLDGDFGEDFFAEKEETSAPENKGSEFGEF